MTVTHRQNGQVSKLLSVSRVLHLRYQLAYHVEDVAKIDVHPSIYMCNTYTSTFSCPLCV